MTALLVRLMSRHVEKQLRKLAAEADDPAITAQADQLHEDTARFEQAWRDRHKKTRGSMG